MAIVFFVGIDADAEQQSRQVRKLWCKYGDVVVVQYPYSRFDLNRIVSHTHRGLVRGGYTRFATIGVSLGAHCAAALVARNAESTTPMGYVGGLLIDPIMDRFDLKPPGNWLSKVAYVWYAGALSNLLSRLFWRLFSAPPTDLGEGANPALVAQAYHTASRWPLSGYTDQIRAILRLRQLGPHALTGRTALMLSSHDQFVATTAATKWQACLETCTIIEVESGHAELPIHPRLWRDATVVGLEWLLGHQTSD